VKDLIPLGTNTSFKNQNCVGQQSHSVVLNQFMKAETVLMKHRKIQQKDRIKSDPLTENENKLNILKKKVPDMITNASCYKENLVMFLLDKKTHKDTSFDYDVLIVLYHLCIDDYSDIIEQVYQLYQEKKVSIQTLSLTVDQDITLCNQVVAEYQNPKLRGILVKIASDKELQKSNKGIYLKKRINTILSGGAWREEAQAMMKIQPPLIRHSDCLPSGRIKH
jgi:hypothetical protein